MIITEYVIKYGKRVPVTQLPKNSTIKVDVRCPSCSTVRTVMYASIVRAGHTICQKCRVAEACEKPFVTSERHNALTFVEKTRKGFSLFRCDCGEEKEIRDWSVRSGRTKTCGCARKRNRVAADNRAENHPGWKGGSSSERGRFMQSALYKAWRHDVFERDSYTCKKCGQVGGKLAAHHLEPYHSCPELRLDLDNGVTLCHGCHETFHNRYGRINFNRDDFQEFTWKLS